MGKDPRSGSRGVEAVHEGLKDMTLEDQIQRMTAMMHEASPEERPELMQILEDALQAMKAEKAAKQIIVCKRET